MMADIIAVRKLDASKCLDDQQMGIEGAFVLIEGCQMR